MKREIARNEHDDQRARRQEAHDANERLIPVLVLARRRPALLVHVIRHRSRRLRRAAASETHLRVHVERPARAARPARALSPLLRRVRAHRLELFVEARPDRRRRRLLRVRARVRARPDPRHRLVELPRPSTVVLGELLRARASLSSPSRRRRLALFPIVPTRFRRRRRPRRRRARRDSPRHHRRRRSPRARGSRVAHSRARARITR